VERLSVGVGIRIVQRPALQQIPHLIAQCLVRLRARLGGSLLRVLRQFRQHPHKRIGDGLVRGGRHCAHDFKHRIDGQPVRRVDRKLGALSAIASHFDQAAQGRRL